MIESTPKETIWSFPYIALMAVNFFQSMAAFMTNTTLPLYLDSLGAATSMVGVVIGAFAITALLVRPFAGPAFDSFSRKRLLLVAQLLIAVSLVGYGVVGSVPGLFCVRLLHGIGIGCAGPLGMSFVSEFLPASRLASGISIYALAQSFAQVIGPAVGLWLVENMGFSNAYFLAAGFLCLAMAGVLFVKEPARERLPYRFAPNRMFAREAVPKAGVLCLLAIAFAGSTSYFVLYGNLLGIEGIGTYFVVYALCLVGTRPAFGKMADRFGSPRVLVVGCLFFAASYVMLWQVRDFAGIIVVAVVGSAGFGACAPLIQSMALGSVPPERRGAASNTAFTGLDLGMLLGPAMAGFVIEALVSVTGGLTQAYSAMWLVMVAPIALALAVVLRWATPLTARP
ncbi:MAG: MFS transporter, partial [Eggerthellaceae bacterium]|nr:MFS transporter [Eggerthellaceae bacterium]